MLRYAIKRFPEKRNKHFIMCGNCLGKDKKETCPNGCDYRQNKQRANPVST